MKKKQMTLAEKLTKDLNESFTKFSLRRRKEVKGHDMKPGDFFVILDEFNYDPAYPHEHIVYGVLAKRKDHLLCIVFFGGESWTDIHLMWQSKTAEGFKLTVKEMKIINKLTGMNAQNLDAKWKKEV